MIYDAVGVDIGGTFIKYALINKAGKILSKGKIETLINNPKKCLDNLSNVILEMIKKNKSHVYGIGIGIPGILDDGKLSFATNMGKWQGLNVATELKKRTKLPSYVSNDANVATLGEAKYGAAKGAANVIMLTLGTGVGGGIVADHKLYEGNKGQGGELGHISIDFNGLQCGCGRKGCLEKYASANALTEQAIEAMKKNKKSYMWKLVNNDITKVDASIPWIAEKHNDPTAKKVIDTYIKYLSEGILNYCIIFRPEVIILAGGVAKQKKNLTDRVNKYLLEHNYGIKNTAKVKVVTAKLGYDTGVYGGATLVFDKFSLSA